MSKGEVQFKTYVEEIGKILPTENNPRKINRKQYDKLKKSLQEFPEMKQLREIVVDENMRILGGHQRLYALKDLGYENVTVKQVTGLSERQKREFTIKDNASSGDWDSDILANEWDVEELEDWGVPKFNLAGADDPDESEKDNKKNHDVECPNCGFTFDPSEE